eukprot:7734928-Pyramimonas_sp.AAC.1
MPKALPAAGSCWRFCPGCGSRRRAQYARWGERSAALSAARLGASERQGRWCRWRWRAARASAGGTGGSRA